MAKNKKVDKKLVEIIAMQDALGLIKDGERMSLGKKMPTSMARLITELKKHNIPYTKKRHEGALEKGKNGKSVIDILGYSPAGLWQITIKHKTRTFSIIRGLVSFGMYEVFKVEGPRHGDGKKRGWAEDPERYDRPEELVADFIKDSKRD
jgi:hypothetical protein